MDNLTVTQAEDKFCQFQKGMLGSFFTLLINAMLHADVGNLEKLKRGFSELADVVERYQNEEGYWESLEKRWNNGHGITVLPNNI